MVNVTSTATESDDFILPIAMFYKHKHFSRLNGEIRITKSLEPA